MQIHVRSAQVPRFLVPLLALAALALIPFALVLALVLAAAAIGVSALRLLLPSPGKLEAGQPRTPFSRAEKRFSDPSAIDAEFVVKDSDEKK